MPEKPAKPSLRAIYRQQRAQDRKAEQSNLPHRILRLVTPAVFLAAAISGAKHWIPASASLIILAGCTVGLAVLVVWSRRRQAAAEQPLAGCRPATARADKGPWFTSTYAHPR